MIQQASSQLPGSSSPHTHQEQPVLLKTADAVAGDSAVPANSVPRFAQEYAELRQLVIEKHLLDKQPAYYTFKILLNFGLLGLGGTMLVLLKDSWFQLLNAAYLAFVFTQMGFIVHDAGHQQILRNGWKNDLIGILHANLLLGFSYIRWVVPHNMHHSKPNQLGADPDMGFRVFAFTVAQASQKRGLLRWIAKYQACAYPIDSTSPKGWGRARCARSILDHYTSLESSSVTRPPVGAHNVRLIKNVAPPRRTAMAASRYFSDWAASSNPQPTSSCT